jgi:hypothetical protein
MDVLLILLYGYNRKGVGITSYPLCTPVYIFVKNVALLSDHSRESNNIYGCVVVWANTVYVFPSFYRMCFDSEIYAVQDLPYTCPCGKGTTVTL